MTVVGVGNRLSAVGASNVNNVGVPPNMETDGFMFWVWQSFNGRMVYHPQVAQGGETLSQTLSRVQDGTNGFPAHPANYGHYPSHALVQCGRNDMIFTTAADVEGKLTTYEQILDYLLSLGILPIVTTTLVSDNATSAAQHQRNLVNFNIGLALMCQKKGLPFVDINPVVVDTTTGGMQSAYEADDLHVNDTGGKLIGAEVANKILGGGMAVPWTPPLVWSNDANTDDALLLTNPLMLSESSGTPTNWTKSGADSANLTNSVASASADGVLGNWFVMTKAATAGDAQNQSSNMTVTAGNWVLVGWAEKYVHTSGTPNVSVRLRTSPGNTDLVLRQIQTTSAQDTGVYRHWGIVKIPASQTAMFLRVTMNAVGVFRLGQVTMVDLSAVGLDTWL